MKLSNALLSGWSNRLPATALVRRRSRTQTIVSSGRAAKNDLDALAAFNLYVIKLNGDATEVVELLSRHPAIEPNATGAGNDLATFVDMPSKGFRLELRDLARHLTRSAIMRGCRGAVTHLDRFLTLSAEGSVSGYEVTVFRGLTMEGEIEIAPGLEIVSYERAAERELVRNEPPGPANDMPDYAGMGALVLAREMTWGPCLVPPRTSRDMGNDAVPTFRWFDGHQIDVLFDSHHHRHVSSNPGAVGAELRTGVRGRESQFWSGIIYRLTEHRPLDEKGSDA